MDEPMTLPMWLQEIGRRLELPFSGQTMGQYLEYARLLREWNEKVNLTAILDDEGIAVRHIMDSLTLLPFLDQYLPKDQAAGLNLIDVGTGAGFPGLPLKIQRPDLQVLLLDSLTKRIRFLDAVIAALHLDGIDTRHDRAEDAGHRSDLRERFDVATARAVASLPVLCEYCLPFVRTGGAFLAMKGLAAGEAAEAARAIHLLGGKLKAVHEFILPGTEMKRAVIIIEKVRPTPAAYPRKAGKPEQQPLL